MKRAFYFFLFCFSLVLSAQNKKDSIKVKQRYPGILKKIFEAHGGLNAWDSIKEMRFTSGKKNISHTVDTHRRREYIFYGDSEMGFDGKHYWKKSETIIKANPIYTINKDFYFLAMPFVLADKGIHYSTQAPLLEHEGTYYPGIKISFDYEIGNSSRDEYILYYNPNTFRMEFLGYTITYYTRRKSTKFYLKRYKNWRWENEVLVPETIENYSFGNKRAWGRISDFPFGTISLSKEITREKLFHIPKNAEKLMNTATTY